MNINFSDPNRPGYLTTEFWGKVAIQILMILVAFNVIHVTDPQLQLLVGLITTTAAEIGYQASRATVKASASQSTTTTTTVSTSSTPATTPPATNTPAA